MNIIIWIAFGIVLAVMLVNAFFMAVSPKAWFGLPKWLGLQGIAEPAAYSSGFRAAQVRVIGVIIIATAGWIAYDLIQHA
jgi:hypothetical protein